MAFSLGCAVQEKEYAVSPVTPLLSTAIEENAWVCGEPDAWRTVGCAACRPGLLAQPARSAWSHARVARKKVARLMAWLSSAGRNADGQLGVGEPTEGTVREPQVLQVSAAGFHHDHEAVQ